MPFIKHIIAFFDKFEDRVRARLSRVPIFYALIGGIGIVLFWKGVWESAEYVPWLSGPVAALVGIAIMLATGLLVSFFIGENIIISGFKGEKKLVEKTELEVRAEADILHTVEKQLDHIEEEIKDLKEK